MTSREELLVIFLFNELCKYGIHFVDVKRYVGLCILGVEDPVRVHVAITLHALEDFQSRACIEASIQ